MGRFLVFFVAGLAGCSATPGPVVAVPPPGVYPVLRVIDGDTLDIGVPLAGGEVLRQRVRLLGLDTPERGQPGYGKAAADLARLAGRAVRIVYDLDGRTRGHYGRLLCWLYQGDTCINIEMRRRGWPPYRGRERKPPP